MAVSKDKEQTYHLITRGNSSSEMLDEAEDAQSQGFLQSGHTPGLGRHEKKSFIRRQIEFVKMNWQFVILLTMLQSIMGILTMGKFFPAKDDGSSPVCSCEDGRPSTYLSALKITLCYGSPLTGCFSMSHPRFGIRTTTGMVADAHAGVAAPLELAPRRRARRCMGQSFVA